MVMSLNDKWRMQLNISFEQKWRMYLIVKKIEFWQPLNIKYNISNQVRTRSKAEIYFWLIYPIGDHDRTMAKLFEELI